MQTLQVRLPLELLRRIDTNRLKMTMRPSRSQMIRFLIENALNIMEEKR
jgi:metal-responsive CopG/Arc/MetJ family transcriptional regulator